VTNARVDVARDGDEVRVSIEGEVDLANADEVEATIVAAVGNEVAGLTVDLAGVEYLDSAGLRILYALATRLRTLQIRLVVTAPEGSVARQVIELAGLDGVVEITP
jgi:stage II sporulation protein AA (anti-sigma F factor antagonist)